MATDKAKDFNLGNLGCAYSDLGDVRKAIDYYNQALAINREIGDRRGEGFTLGNLGDAYSDLGDVSKAIDYFNQALEIDRETGYRQGEGIDLGNLGTAYSDLGDVRKPSIILIRLWKLTERLATDKVKEAIWAIWALPTQI